MRWIGVFLTPIFGILVCVAVFANPGLSATKENNNLGLLGRISDLERELGLLKAELDDQKKHFSVVDNNLRVNAGDWQLHLHRNGGLFWQQVNPAGEVVQRLDFGPGYTLASSIPFLENVGRVDQNLVLKAGEWELQFHANGGFFKQRVSGGSVSDRHDY